MSLNLATDTALVIIDLQRGTAANPFVDPIEPVAARAGALAEAFRARGLPVAIAIFALGGPGSGRPEPEGSREPLAALGSAPDDILVTRSGWSAFADTDLHEALRGRGAETLVLAGVATSIGVESTARAARDLGYRVVLASDATTDLSAELSENSVTRIFPLLGQVSTSAEIEAALEA